MKDTDLEGGYNSEEGGTSGKGLAPQGGLFDGQDGVLLYAPPLITMTTPPPPRAWGKAGRAHVICRMEKESVQREKDDMTAWKPETAAASH